MTFAPVPDVPADLWSRFTKLSQRCEIDVTSEVKYGPSVGVQRAWRVVVHAPESAKPGTPPVTTYGVSSAAAIVEAVREAEARGWLDGTAAESEHGRHPAAN
jgi:hypothetical protein